MWMIPTCSVSDKLRIRQVLYPTGSLSDMLCNRQAPYPTCSVSDRLRIRHAPYPTGLVSATLIFLFNKFQTLNNCSVTVDLRIFTNSVNSSSCKWYLFCPYFHFKKLPFHPFYWHPRRQDGMPKNRKRKKRRGNDRDNYMNCRAVWDCECIPSLHKVQCTWLIIWRIICSAFKC